MSVRVHPRELTVWVPDPETGEAYEVEWSSLLFTKVNGIYFVTVVSQSGDGEERTYETNEIRMEIP